MGIKFVWFDLGYTLVYTKREKYFQNFISSVAKNIDINEIQMAYNLTDKLFMREHRGLLCKSKEEYMPHYYKKLFEFLKVDIDINQALTCFLNGTNNQIENPQRTWFVYENSVEVLSTLKRNSIRVGLISNWDNTSREILKQNALDTLLDEVVISSEVGYSKPDKDIFDFAINKAKVKSEECLFVCDNYYDDVIGSDKVNMNSILINPYDRFGIEELRDIEIISNVSEVPRFIQKNYNQKLY